MSISSCKLGPGHPILLPREPGSRHVCPRAARSQSATCPALPALPAPPRLPRLPRRAKPGQTSPCPACLTFIDVEHPVAAVLLGSPFADADAEPG